MGSTAISEHGDEVRSQMSSAVAMELCPLGSPQYRKETEVKMCVRVAGQSRVKGKRKKENPRKDG
jgi:hypothetical protein